MEEIVKKLTELKKMVATMESCTGGGFVNAITNVPGASEVIKFSAVTYSNEYKIKMGVDSSIIDKYTVYSKETARDMSKKISDFADSNYGIGITGKINNHDKNNLGGKDNKVYFCIYDKDKDEYYDFDLIVSNNERSECKKEIILSIIQEFKRIIC